MDVGTFFDKMDGHPELSILHINEGRTAEEDSVIVANKRSGTYYNVELSSIMEYSWSELEGVLTGKRRERLLNHMSRVVGYYSLINNWNKSKLGELRDRRRGDYAVTAVNSRSPATNAAS